MRMQISVCISVYEQTGRDIAQTSDRKQAECASMAGLVEAHLQVLIVMDPAL